MLRSVSTPLWKTIQFVQSQMGIHDGIGTLRGWLFDSGCCAELHGFDHWSDYFSSFLNPHTNNNSRELSKVLVPRVFSMAVWSLLHMFLR